MLYYTRRTGNAAMLMGSVFCPFVSDCLKGFGCKLWFKATHVASKVVALSQVQLGCLRLGAERIGRKHRHTAGQPNHRIQPHRFRRGVDALSYL
jgi:hypothetical protein